MPENSEHTQSVTLSLPLEEQWTLHHVLLDRIERELTATDPTTVDPPPVEVFQAFETLDAGHTRFTIAQLDAIQAILAEYHHSPTWWELERPRLEQLLHRVSRAIDGRGPALSAD
ncbi:DUF7853 family protein [Natronorubrum sp. FCH18a]|uniref:DUF7853 family protein n=1 Tax=Natronorubrum sp. FCH18a TaxID=3447018 RepID=UPI003F51A975